MTDGAHSGRSANSFCKQSKEEVANKPLFSRRDKCAFLSALTFAAGSLVLHGNAVSVAYATQNEALARELGRLADELTGRACVVTKKGKSHEVLIENALTLLCDCRVLRVAEGSVTVCDRIDPTLVSDQSAAAAYVRGAYLGAGSLTAEKYHLEFSFGRKTIAEDFAGLLERFAISAKIAVRHSRAVVYAKDGDAISDCLALMGAAKAVLSLNSLMAARQMNEHANRLKNCDINNIDKQVEAGVRQCAAIRALDLDELTPQLKETARLRLENPEMSCEELGKLLGITKSGVKNRLRRLCEIADAKTRGKKEEK